MRHGGYVYKDDGGSTSDPSTSDPSSGPTSFGDAVSALGDSFSSGPFSPPSDTNWGSWHPNLTSDSTQLPNGDTVPQTLMTTETSGPHWWSLAPTMWNRVGMSPVRTEQQLDRTPMYAEGGATHRGQNPDVTSPPTRQDMALQVGMTPRGPVVGLIKSPVPGRTDRLPMQVYDDSYVIPADVVSNGYGQGNTEAGARILDQMLGQHHERGATNAPHLVKRGTVPIVAAGGEFVVHPFAVASLGGGDLSKGHKALDEMVKTRRKEAARQQLRLPGPKKN